MKVTKDLRSLSREERREKLQEFKKELLKLNVQVATGANTSNPSKLRQVKKNIARILTFENEESKQ